MPVFNKMKKNIKIRHKNHNIKISCFFRSGKKEPLIFLHGLGCSKEDFLRVFKSKKFNGYPILTFDIPGSNHSVYPNGVTLGLNDIVLILDKIIEAFGFKKIFLIGHSWGGDIALIYSLKFPGKVLGLVNIEGTLNSVGISWLEKVKKMGFNKFKGRFFENLKDSMKKSKINNLDKYSKSLEKTSSRAYFNYCSSTVNFCKDGKSLKKFINLDIPKILIYGERNKDWLEVLPELKKHKCLIAKIPRSHHFSYYDNPRFLFGVIKKFIKNKVK